MTKSNQEYIQQNPNTKPLREVRADILAQLALTKLIKEQS